MATAKFQPNAAQVYQQATYTPANVASTNTFTLTCNGKAVTFTAVTNTAASVSAGLYALLTSTTSPPPAEFQELTWTDNVGTLTGVAKVKGVPFTITPSASGGTATLTAGSTVAASGPNDAGLTANWSTGATPANTNDIVLENTVQGLLYNLGFGSITAGSIRVESTYSGNIGLPFTNPNGGGYKEYRGTYFTIKSPTLLFNGTSQRAKFDLSSTNTTITVNNTGTPAETGLGALLLKGSAIVALNINKGYVDVAPFDDETSTVTTATIGYVTSQASDATVRFGKGTTLTTLIQNGGKVQTNAGLTTATLTAGTLTHNAGDITTVTVRPADGTTATLIVNGVTTITTLNLTGVLDLSQGAGTVTITNTNLYAGAKIIDPYRRAVWSNPIALLQCGIKDVDVDFGQNITLQPTAA